MTTRIEESVVEGSPETMAKEMIFAAYMNRDSLSRSVNQHKMMEIDGKILHLNSLFYGLLDRALARDEDIIKKIHISIQCVLEDINNIEDDFFEKGYERQYKK